MRLVVPPQAPGSSDRRRRSLLRREVFLEVRFTLAFVGYDPEAGHALVELTQSWDQATPYEIGSGFAISRLGSGISTQSMRRCSVRAPESPMAPG